MSKDFAALIGSWPRHGDRTSITSFAMDVGLDYQHAATMKQRNSVPPDFWPKLLKAAARRGKELSHEQLLVMRGASKRRKAKRVRPNQRVLGPVEVAA